MIILGYDKIIGIFDVHVNFIVNRAHTYNYLCIQLFSL